MQDSKYIIDGHSFEVETKGIIGLITEDAKFKWAMDIYAAEGEYDGQRTNPKFSFAQLAATENFKFDQEFIWEKATAYDNEIDDWVGDFLIFDAQYFECRVQMKRVGAQAFLVSIKGKVNMNWETAPEQHFVDFEIIQTLPFNGILCEIDDAPKTKELAEKYLSFENLEWNSESDHEDWSNSWYLPK